MTTPQGPQLEVEVEVNQLDGGQVELQVRVPAGPVSRVRDQVLKAFSRGANIPGFRRGKAPRTVVERFVDQEALGQQIIDSLVPDAYEAATEKAGIRALDRARIADAGLSDDGGLTFKATVTVRPEITLGEYKGLSVTRHVTAVTEAQVEIEVERVRSRHARFVELPPEAGIGMGDLVVVDYEMFVGEEKREDASASGYPLEVGADQLFPELNEALLGAKPGETREFEITYPDTHSDESLAGKAARFRVVAQQARRRELPDLDDEFVKQVSDAESVAALRDRIRQSLEAIGKTIADEEVRSQLLQRISETTSLNVPQALVDRETERRIDEITQELERRSLSLRQHLDQTGRSFEDWRADLEAEARQTARRALILDEIGSREKIEVTEEEVNQEIARIAAAEGRDEERVRERLSDSAEFSRLINRLYQRKVSQFVVASAEITDEVVAPEADGGEVETPESQGAASAEEEGQSD